MSVAFDRIVVAVPNLTAAVAEYELLLGAPFWLRGEGAATEPTAWIALPNTVLELRQQPVLEPAIVGVVFAGEAAHGDAVIDHDRDVSIGFCDGSATQRFRAERGAAHQALLRVDHLVLHTGSAQACIDLFEQRLGLRLALDKDAPQWGGRMLFFRSGKLTLEVIEPAKDKPEHDFFWGIAYQCADIEDCLSRLGRANVSASTARDGRKANTLVATVKSHHLGIPTLLVQPAV